MLHLSALPRDVHRIVTAFLTLTDACRMHQTCSGMGLICIQSISTLFFHEAWNRLENNKQKHILDRICKLERAVVQTIHIRAKHFHPEYLMRLVQACTRLSRIVLTRVAKTREFDLTCTARLKQLHESLDKPFPLAIHTGFLHINSLFDVYRLTDNQKRLHDGWHPDLECSCGTPLVYAVNASYTMAIALLNADADCRIVHKNQRSSNGRTAWECMLTQNAVPVVEHVLRYESKRTRPRSVPFDINHEIDPVARPGWTGLHAAASHGHTDLVQLLLSCGANVNQVAQATRHHVCPLHSWQSNWMPNWSIQRRADSDSTFHDAMTPLGAALVACVTRPSNVTHSDDYSCEVLVETARVLLSAKGSKVTIREVKQCIASFRRETATPARFDLMEMMFSRSDQHQEVNNLKFAFCQQYHNEQCTRILLSVT